MLRDQDAIFLDAGFNLDYRAVARIAGDQLFGVVDDELDWPAGLFCQRIAESNVVAIALAAKIAANIARTDDQAVRSNLQCISHLLAHAKRAFVRRPNFRRAVTVDSDQRRMRLDIALMDCRHRKGIFNDHVRLAETFCDLAFLPRQMDKDVARRIYLVYKPL